MPQLAIVADDLTGAADTGSCFAAAGFSTVIPMTFDRRPTADVLVFSTETRDLEAAAASEIVSRVVSGLLAGVLAAPPTWLYKKIDSALRGHPRDELLAAMNASGITRALVAPAFPAEGRTTVGGEQRLHGVPLAEHAIRGPRVASNLATLFVRDRGIAVRALEIAVVRAGPEAIRAFLTQAPAGIVVADAETDADLAALAQTATSLADIVLCGSAGFARQLAAVLPIVPENPPPVVPSGSGPILVVAGSRHEVTVRQIAHFHDNGVPIVRLDQAMIDDSAAGLDRAVSEAAAHLSRGHSTVVTTSGLAPAAIRERAVAAKLAAIATSPEIVGTIGGLVLTGGDVANAVCAALASQAFWLRGDVVPGVPWGTLAGGERPGLLVATKAGSFGGEATLMQALAFLGSIVATSSAG